MVVVAWDELPQVPVEKEDEPPVETLEVVTGSVPSVMVVTMVPVDAVPVDTPPVVQTYSVAVHAVGTGGG